MGIDSGSKAVGGNVCPTCGKFKMSLQSICTDCKKKQTVSKPSAPATFPARELRAAVRALKLEDPTALKFEDSSEKKFGHLYEDLLFGEFHISREYVQEALELLKRFGSKIPEERRMGIIRKYTLNAKNNPTSPQPRFARELRERIARELGVDDTDENQREMVKFYTGVGTGLDTCEGVDGWFDIKMNGKTISVRCDVTADTGIDKLRGAKASVVITDVPYRETDTGDLSFDFTGLPKSENNFKVQVDRYAGEIVRKFRKQQENISA